jgi:hypothetical protein
MTGIQIHDEVIELPEEHEFIEVDSFEEVKQTLDKMTQN